MTMRWTPCVERSVRWTAPWRSLPTRWARLSRLAYGRSLTARGRDEPTNNRLLGSLRPEAPLHRERLPDEEGAQDMVSERHPNRMRRGPAQGSVRRKLD